MPIDLSIYKITEENKGIYDPNFSAPVQQKSHLDFFYDETIRRNAQVVLELGAGALANDPDRVCGYSTRAFIEALKVTGGRLVSIDKERRCEKISTWPRWTFLCGDDLNLPGYLLDLVPKEVDILFIDTSHVFEHTQKELERYAPLVKDDGLILMHDVTCTTMGNDVVKAIQGFLSNNQGKYSYELLFEEAGGLGKITKNATP